MANRPVSRLGGRVTPSTSRETNTPRLKSMIVVPTELVMTGAPISAAFQLQNRRAINTASHITNNASHVNESFRQQNNASRHHNESFRQNGNASHLNESFRRGNNGHNVTMPSSHLSSMTASSSHNNESFVRSSDEDDEEVSSVTSGSDESDLAQSPAADIIRATYTSPIFDVSNRTLSTNLDSIEPSSVEPCPVDGCPLNPKSRVS